MKLILVCLIFNICLQMSWADPSKLRSIEWKEISHKEGIKVFIPENYAHNTGLIPIRFEATLDFELARVLTVLADNSRKTQWLPRASEVKLIEQNSLDDFVVYYRYNLPWPIKDRDFLIKNLGKLNPETQVVSVDMFSVVHPKDPNPEHEGAVRGQTHDGYTIIKALSPHKTYVEMAIITDFKGLIPVFIINSIQKNWPYRFIQNLREQLAKKDITLNPEFNFEKK